MEPVALMWSVMHIAAHGKKETGEIALDSNPGSLAMEEGTKPY